jgi:hypothetical protein
MSEHILNVLSGIAVSKWSESQRRALVRILLAPAELSFATEDFVPGIWNRRAKAAKALRELEKAHCITRDNGRWLVIESSFCVSTEIELGEVTQLALPEEKGLGAALAKVCPVQDRTGRPSQDGPSGPSGTGPGTGSEENASGAMGLTVSGGVSQLRRARVSNGMEGNSIQFDTRRGPSRDVYPTEFNARKDYHRECVLELLAKNPNLSSLRAELNKRRSPTAVRFWQLFESNPVRAARLIKEVADKKKPGAFLNRCLMNETIPTRTNTHHGS